MKKILVLIATILCSLPALASSPASLVTGEVITDPGPMPGNDVAIPVEIFNGYDHAVTVTLEKEYRDGILLIAYPGKLRLQPGERTAIEVSGQVTAKGKYAVFLHGKVVDEEGTQLHDAVLRLHMRAVGERGPITVTLEDYDSLFVAEGLEDVPGIGPSYPALPGAPKDTAKPGRLVPQSGDESPAEEETPGGDSPRFRATPEWATITMTIKGEFRWVDTKGKGRPATNWRAALYVIDGGKWVDTGARATVGSDAKYSMKATTGAGAKCRIVMFPSNRYFDLLNQQGNRFQWHLTQFDAMSHNITVAPHYIDLNAVNVPGLGELHADAYDLWIKLDNANFSPLRSKPIRIIFPGTNDCGSCTENGTVHIDEADAAGSHTIRHELGHELMYEYWGGMPSGSGGYHEWGKCYNEGLALSEGFAHFVSWWSTVNRLTLTGSWGGGWNGESLPSSVCKVVGKNEMRVAATFWDLHDSKVDGVDLYTNADPGRILTMILGGSKVNSFTTLMYPRLETTGGIEWWRIEPIAEMNFAN